jgi:hypothetical protein
MGSDEFLNCCGKRWCRWEHAPVGYAAFAAAIAGPACSASVRIFSEAQWSSSYRNFLSSWHSI